LLGLAALAALTVAAFVGPGSASATTLCSVNQANCPVGARYSASTTVGPAEALEGPAVVAFAVLGVPVEIECEVAGSKAFTFAESGAPLMGAFGMYTFETCVSGLGICTVAEIDSAYSAAFEATGGGNGSLLVEMLNEGPPGLEVQCGALTCLYAAESVELQVIGGEPAAWVVNEAPLTLQPGSGGACSENATWSAEYTIVAPEVLFVAAAP
jgi:hypothetical protein